MVVSIQKLSAKENDDMKTLLQNGSVVNVFTDTIQKADVLIDGEKIVGVGSYSAEGVDRVVDVTGKYACLSFRLF